MPTSPLQARDPIERVASNYEYKRIGTHGGLRAILGPEQIGWSFNDCVRAGNACHAFKHICHGLSHVRWAD